MGQRATIELRREREAEEKTTALTTETPRHGESSLLFISLRLRGCVVRIPFENYCTA
jgi:uncharacterized membrane-anchored protein